MSNFDKTLAAAMGIVLVLAFVAVANKVMASDENGETFCLAQNIYFEAGNQPEAGKVAVANVTMNRMKSQAYPSTICNVVYQARWETNWRGDMIPVRNKCQFSWFCDGRSDLPTDSATWMKSLEIANFALAGAYFDVTSGATHYHSDSVYPYWADHLNRTVTIDNHLFYN